jgi:hypothetical protein
MTIVFINLITNRSINNQTVPIDSYLEQKYDFGCSQKQKTDVLTSAIYHYSAIFRF